VKYTSRLEVPSQASRWAIDAALEPTQVCRSSITCKRTCALLLSKVYSFTTRPTHLHPPLSTRSYNDFYMTLFNVIFTSLTPFVIGVFDRDVDKAACMRFPQLYKQGDRR
jgi:hypothetical protein